MIRVVLPYHLRTLAKVRAEVQLDIEGPLTQRSVLDALEARYPTLCGTIRDHITGKRRPLLRFYACEEDLSYESPDAPLPEAVASGKETFFIIGAIAAVKKIAFSCQPAAPARARRSPCWRRGLVSEFKYESRGGRRPVLLPERPPIASDAAWQMRRDILGTSGKLHRCHTLGNQIRAARADDVNAQDAIGLGIGEDLDYSLGFVHAASARIGLEGKFTNAILTAAGLDLLFGLANTGHFRPGVDHARHGIVVDVRFHPG